MLDRLDYLFDRDTKSRWRIILCSALSVSIIGLIAQSSGAPLIRARLAASVLGLVVFAVQVFFYVAPSQEIVSRLQLRAPTYLFRSSIAVIASALFALLASVSAPVVQAAILNRRLRNVVALVDISGSVRAQATDRIFTVATRSPVLLQKDLVKKATQQIQGLATPEAWQAYVSILNYTVNWRTWGNSGPRREDLAAYQERMQRIESRSEPVCGPGNYGLTLMSFTTKDGRVTKIDPDYPLRWPRAIGACRLSLDGANLRDTVLNYVRVQYQGGSLDLTNVRFEDVLFDLENNANTRTFAEALLRSDDNVLTLHID